MPAPFQCPGCGAQTDSTDRFCDSCGASLLDHARPAAKPRGHLLILSLAAVAIFIGILVALMARKEGGSISSREVSASAGGELELYDGFKLLVPPGTLANGSLKVRAGVPNPSHRLLPGTIYQVEAASQVLDRPVTLEIPYLPEEIPQGYSEQNLLGLTYRDEAWLELPTVLDKERRRVIVSVRHLCHFTWIAKEGQLTLAGKLGLGYRLIAGPVFGPQLDAWKAIRRDRADYDALADQLLKLVEIDPQGIGMEWSGEAVARVRVGSNEFALVETPYRSPGGRGKLPAVLDAQGKWIRDLEILYKVLFVHEVRRYLKRVDRVGHAATLRQNSRVLGKMLLLHAIANEMDAVQEVLAKVLATGTVGVGVNADLTQYVIPILSYLVRRLTQLEMARLKNQMEEVALLLEKVHPDTLNYRPASYLYSLMVDIPARARNIKVLATKSFPGAGENWVKYTAKRVAGAFFGAAVDRSMANLHYMASRPGMDVLRKRLLSDLQVLGEGASAGWAFWGMLEAAINRYVPLATYVQACQLRDDAIGVVPIYAAARLLAGATEKVEQPDKGIPDRAPKPSLDGRWKGSFDYCYHPPGYEPTEVKCNNSENMICTISGDKMTCSCDGGSCGLATELEQVSLRCTMGHPKSLECNHSVDEAVDVRWLLNRD